MYVLPLWKDRGKPAEGEVRVGFVGDVEIFLFSRNEYNYPSLPSKNLWRGGVP